MSFQQKNYEMDGWRRTMKRMRRCKENYEKE